MAGCETKHLSKHLRRVSRNVSRAGGPLAVDGRQQGKGLERILLVDAMQQCQRAGQILGVRLMLLDVAGPVGEAERARLHSFYASMGFRPLPGRPDRLFLSLSALPPLQSGG